MIADLVNRVQASTGLDPADVEKAVGMILGFLQKEGPRETIDSLFGSAPGAQELVDQHGGEPGGMMGMLGGMMGGGIMALGSQLMAAGLSMEQIQTVGRELLAFARSRLGEDQVGRIVAQIPGLSQFV